MPPEPLAAPWSGDDPLVDVGAFFEFSLDLLVIRDLEGRVLKASSSWRTLLGHDPEELRGQPLLGLVHPDDMPGTLESVEEVENRRPGAPVLGFTNRYRHKDGRYLTLEWRAQRFGDRIYGVARDVTERVAAERELREAKVAAEAASRAKSDFLANMSHEIRTPLNGVIGIVDALARTPLAVDQAEMVDLIRNSGTVLERLVSDILDVSKIEAGELPLEIAPFDLELALGPCIEVMRYRAADKGLAFELARGPGARGLFVGDGARIAQIVANLLSNAIKFTPSGTVALRLDLADDGRLTLVVEDTGVGFDAEHASRLFNRFSQADASISRRFGGTGLGLSICRSLTEMMGGEIAATSQPGVGSRFVVALPLVRAEPADETRGVRPVPAPAPACRAAGPLRVLLAEDHPTNQRVVQLILASQGAELVIVEDGAQALEAFAAGAFDLVLMDMQMPHMDGLAATRAIRALEAERGAAPVPIVMLSANAMAEHLDEARAAGADLHVAKPITASSLLAGIEAALAGA
ncbi:MULTISPECIES: ATP-binding protein [unclassified Phenylobacterium]|uniref:PAS domain-containing hybrid sensor histidine kinase/response regulator n=1 Tax=unclassified Phenylobacterium TaxID=2640670 RepID=UPI0022B54261|nr:ATP-binding protein [Phenylobacterium sp. NIBR 498073]MBS0490941.1 response regulator [Pseudomonadota bacterium]WGU40526.1 ATP-binding protein [Phenylobacterium sp. NIBR 498073]